MAEPTTTPALTPLELWTQEFTARSAQGYSQLDAIEEIERRHRGISVAAKAEVTRLARLGRPPSGALPPSVAPTGRR